MMDRQHDIDSILDLWADEELTSVEAVEQLCALNADTFAADIAALAMSEGALSPRDAQKLRSLVEALNRLSPQEEEIVSRSLSEGAPSGWEDYLISLEEDRAFSAQRRMARALQTKGASEGLVLYCSVVPGIIPEISGWLDDGTLSVETVEEFEQTSPQLVGLWLTLKARIEWSQNEDEVEALALLRVAEDHIDPGTSAIFAETKALIASGRDA
ncbi:MAG: hypothetical protein KC561_04545 [Myxococcales bacterium]|nr:hypothetical protein [Myxococcales bacterium]